MRQLHNELIASPADGGLLGARHAYTNDMIISDTMLHSLAPTQLPCDYLPLDVVKQVIKNKALYHYLLHHLYWHIWIQVNHHHLVKR